MTRHVPPAILHGCNPDKGYTTEGRHDVDDNFFRKSRRRWIVVAAVLAFLVLVGWGGCGVFLLGVEAQGNRAAAWEAAARYYEKALLDRGLRVPPPPLPPPSDPAPRWL